MNTVKGPQQTVIDLLEKAESIARDNNFTLTGAVCFGGSAYTMKSGNNEEMHGALLVKILQDLPERTRGGVMMLCQKADGIVIETDEQETESLREIARRNHGVVSLLDIAKAVGPLNDIMRELDKEILSTRAKSVTASINADFPTDEAKVEAAKKAGCE